jgi:hypothetical protein
MGHKTASFWDPLLYSVIGGPKNGAAFWPQFWCRKSNQQTIQSGILCMPYAHLSSIHMTQQVTRTPATDPRSEHTTKTTKRKLQTLSHCLHISCCLSLCNRRNLKLYVRWVAKQKRCTVKTALSFSECNALACKRQMGPNLMIHPVTPVLGPESGPANC